MVFPAEFITRFAIPLTVAAFFFDIIPEQVEIYDKILVLTDQVLAKAKGQGEGPTESFDYIIVGGGSAGAIVANRLSASGEFSVLLLEGGGDPNPLSDLPFALGYARQQSTMTINYETVRQEKSCLGRQNGICWYPRGRALGGSSSINGVLYHRGMANDYDMWANYTGNPIWRHESVLDAFKTIEDYHGFYEDNPGPNHGSSGEMYVGRVEYIPASEVFFEAISERGIPVADLNTGLQSYGFSKIDYNIKNGLRWGTYQAFLEPILDRSNLHVYRYSQVTKVHFDGSKKAIGVSYKRHGTTRYVTGNKEIILSTGVIDSPKLLMLSGIGPAAHLQSLGIETIVDLPAVGKHLQDHPGVEMTPFYLNKTFGSGGNSIHDLYSFLVNQSGPVDGVRFGGPLMTQTASGHISSTRNADLSWPDLHIYIRQKLQTPGEPNEMESVFFAIELMKPKSEGSILLKSNNPDDDPLIDPNYFSDPSDLERLVDGIDFMMDIFLNTTAYKSVGIKFDESVHPINGCTGSLSREYWKCYAQHVSESYMHPTSTCRMGPNNSVAVVDSELRVYGTLGLRVVDSSIMPFVISGNTNFPSMMIGEMGSRLILNTVDTESFTNNICERP